MTTSYNIATDQQAYNKLDENGNATIILQGKTPLKPRAVHISEASLRCGWIQAGESSSWHFNPAILNPSPARYSQTTDGQTHLLTVELGKLTPAHGLIDRNRHGEIRTSAVHLDLPAAADPWYSS